MCGLAEKCKMKASGGHDVVGSMSAEVDLKSHPSKSIAKIMKIEDILAREKSLVPNCSLDKKCDNYQFIVLQKMLKLETFYKSN